MRGWRGHSSSVTNAQALPNRVSEWLSIRRSRVDGVSGAWKEIPTFVRICGLWVIARKTAHCASASLFRHTAFIQFPHP